MDDLVRWLAGQLEEDERIAKAATPGPWRVRGEGVVGDGGHWPVAYTDSYRAEEDCLHVAEHDPTRVLEEVTAKYKLIAWARKQPPPTAERVVRLLAAVYVHRPGYREEWRP